MRTSAIVLVVLLAGGLVAVAPAQTRPAGELVLPTHPDLLKQYRNQIQYVSRLKLDAKYRSVADLLQTKIEDGGINVKSMTTAPNQQVRVELDDLPGLTSFMGNRANTGYVQLVNILPSAQGYASRVFSGSGGSVNINITEFTTKTQSTISLNQNMMAGQGQNVTLSIYRVDRSGGAVREQKNYRAGSLDELRRRHPDAEDELRTLLGQFGQQHLLAAEPHMAWQVFARDQKPGPDMVKQVEALVKQLDADDSKSRDAAVTKLQELGAQGMLAMVRVDRKDLSLEQQFRLDSAVEPYQTMPADMAGARRDDTSFLLDCLICEDPLIPPLALARLKTLTGIDTDFRTDAPLNDRIKAVRTLREAIARAAATRPAR